MNHVEGLKNVGENNKRLASAIPNEMKAFSGLVKNVLTDNTLSMKQKELIALGIAVAVRCEGCIESHINNLTNLGATKQEVAEAISVAILMGGGPSTVYGGKALEAFDQLSEE